MNLNQLWVFYNVAKCKSFSKAAEQLFLTQPAISTQVKRFEVFYNVKLFERFARTIQLTDQGRALYAHATKIFDLVQEVENAIACFIREGDVSDGWCRDFKAKMLVAA
jgi:DNA-binding transcriptional LysR family regulator